MITERLVHGFDILRRRWLYLLLPFLAAIPVAYFLVKAAPVKYVAKAIILLQSANRSADWSTVGGSFPRQNAIEQISVVEAWLKSDHVLDDLLPQLIDHPVPETAHERAIELIKLRSALTFELVGNAVLEMRFEGSIANGLGRKLEIIVTRLLEGVLNPEEGILSAEQMILVRRGDAAREAERGLGAAIAAAQIGPVDIIKNKLKLINQLQRGRIRTVASAVDPMSVTAKGSLIERATTQEAATVLPVTADRSRLLSQLDSERKSLSGDAATVERLEKLYAHYEELQLSVEVLVQKSRASNTTYVRIFDSPERLTIIGRPRDPLVGEKSARKYAIAALMGVLLVSSVFIVLLEFLDPRVYSRDDFESVSGLTVVARLPRHGTKNRTSSAEVEGSSLRSS
jgi:hypothetical protein